MTKRNHRTTPAGPTYRVEFSDGSSAPRVWESGFASPQSAAQAVARCADWVDAADLEATWNAVRADGGETYTIGTEE